MGNNLFLNRNFLNKILPILLGSLPLLWTRPFNLLLYGQDYLSVIDPFKFTYSPFVLYYAPSSMMSGEYVRFYNDVIITFFTRIGFSYALSERFVIVIGTIVIVYGVFGLFSTINKISGFNEDDHLLGKVFASLFFVMNPFTLTVTWPFLENWTIFLMFLPFWLSFLLDVYYSDKINLQKFLLTCVLAIILAPGVAGVFSVCLLIPLSLILLLETKNIVFHKDKLNHFKKVGVIIAAYISTIWTIVPFIFSPITSGSRLTTPVDLQNFFSSSLPTSTFNVLRLMGFGWIYVVPDKYPWISYVSVLNLAITIFIAILFCGLFLTKKFRAVAGLAVFTMVIIFLSKGYQPPFESINLNLLLLKGPFLLLSNAYYFITQYYVLFLSILVFVVVTYLFSNIRQNWSKIRASFFNHVLPNPKVLGSLSIFIVLIASFTISMTPFFLNQVYQSNGPDINAFELPDSFSELSIFFDQNFKGSNYNALVLPVASTNRCYYYTFNNNSFADANNLLAYFVPYPTIWSIENEQQAELVNRIALINNFFLSTETIGNLLSAFNIKYIIVNPYAQSFHSVAPNGLSVNWNKVVNSLNNTIGPAIKVGEFLIFVNNGVKPAIRTVPQLNVFSGSSFSQYLDVVSSVNSSSSPLSEAIASSTWVNRSITHRDEIPINMLFFYPFKKTSIEFNISEKSNVLAIMNNGSVIEITKMGKNGAPFYFEEPILSDILQSEQKFLYNIQYRNNSIMSSFNETSMLAINSTVGQAFLTNLQFQAEQWMDDNWVEAYYNSDNISIVATLYFAQTSNFLSMELRANNLLTGKQYVWNSNRVSLNFFNSTFEWVVRVNKDMIFSDLFSNSSSEPFASVLLKYNGDEEDLLANPGCDLDAVPESILDISNLSLTLKIINPKLALHNFSIYEESGIKHFIVSSNPVATEKISYQTKGLYNGNYELQIESGPVSFFTIVDYTYSSAWDVSLHGNGKTTRLEIGDAINLFYINNLDSDSLITLSIEYQSLSSYMLVISWIELVIFSCLYVFLKYFKKNK